MSSEYGSRTLKRVENLVANLCEQRDRLQQKVKDLLEDNQRLVKLVEELGNDEKLMKRGWMKLPVDRDGVPIWPGEDIYDEDGREVYVYAVSNPKTKMFPVYIDKDGRKSMVKPRCLTHEKPDRFPLDADGIECKMLDTVYNKAGTAFTVIGIGEDFEHVRVRHDSGEDEVLPANLFTHTEPDSWKKLAEDATVEPLAYLERHDLLGIDIPTVENFASDLVRRAKKLAGVDAE